MNDFHKMIGISLVSLLTLSAIETADSHASASHFQPSAAFTNGSTDGAIPSCRYTTQELAQQLLRQGPSRHSGAYVSPKSQTLAALRQSIRLTQQGQTAQAKRQAASADYELCQSPHDPSVTVMRPRDLTVGDAVILLRPDAHVAATLEVPYLHSEPQTGQRALEAFHALQAQALVLSGTHRCGSQYAAQDTELTSACGRQARARVSDMGLAPMSTFRAATDILTDTTDWVVRVDQDETSPVSVWATQDPRHAATHVPQALRVAFHDHRVHNTSRI